jgi:hypothetical protein
VCAGIGILTVYALIGWFGTAATKSAVLLCWVF